MAISLSVASQEARWQGELNLLDRIYDRVLIRKISRMSVKDEVDATVSIPIRHIGRMASYLERTYSEPDPRFNVPLDLYSEGLRETVHKLETARHEAGRAASFTINSYLLALQEA